MKPNSESSGAHTNVARMKDWAPFGPVVLGGLSYILCSSFMLIISKVAVNNMPMIAFGVSVQLAFSVVAVLLLKASKLVFVGTLTRKSAMEFLPFGLSYAAFLYTNSKVLYSTNVESIVVTRACAPVILGIIDGLLAGRDLPSVRSISAVALVAFGTCGYVFSEHFNISWWSTALLVAFTIELWHGRRLVLSGQSEGSSAPSSYAAVLYTNIVGLPLMFALAAFSGELSAIVHQELKPSFIFMPLVSSFLGFYACVSMWEFRGKVAPTSFALLTYACNFMAIVVNVTMLSNQASYVSVGCIILCLVGGALYHAETFYDIDAEAAPARDYSAHKAAADKWRGYKRKATAPPLEQGPNYWQNRICVAFTVFMVLLIAACSFAFGGISSLGLEKLQAFMNQLGSGTDIGSSRINIRPDSLMRHHHDHNQHQVHQHHQTSISAAAHAVRESKLSINIPAAGIEKHQ